jgi:hypothetical protein
MRTGFVLFAALTLSACHVVGLAPEESDVIRRTFDVPQDAGLHLRSDLGTVTVRTWDKNQVEVVATKRTRFGRQALHDMTVEATLASDTVAVASRKTSLLGLVSVDYALTVPAGMSRADIGVSTGTVDVAGIAGDAVIKATTGTIRLADVKGRADLETTTGDMTVRNLAGSLKASLTTGSMEARNIGRIEGMVTTTGSIDATVSTIAPETTISTTTGDITLRLAPSFGARIDASTVTGGIEHALVPVTTTTSEKQRLVGQIGQGSDGLRVATTTGSIRLLKD